jgi:hypothetical protein
MASVCKHGNKWQARIQRRDQPSISKSFHTKADALKWARSVEAQADLGALAPRQTVPRLAAVQFMFQRCIKAMNVIASKC